ncbi:MAG TPA: hypothetical protein VGI83_06730 [Gemmatimonadales bacterium]|jgi:hypothetical protein
MYCNLPLGTNEMVEVFPVGRRLAFDPGKGRLWVVCPACERWNLSPLDERWEAIEACEKMFRDTRLRVSTDNIGLARLKEGLELVRIGVPQRPEFAAWRYGDQFGRRRRRQMVFAGAGLTLLGGIVAGAAIATVQLGGMSYGIMQVARLVIRGSPRKVVARLALPDGVLKVRRKDLEGATMEHHQDATGDWALRVRAGDDYRVLTGEEARKAAGLLLPAINRYGGNRQQVKNAVAQIESVGDPRAFPHALLERSAGRVRRPLLGHPPGAKLTALANEERLALEMAVHEEAERRAMEGELWLLEQAWKNAESLAAISDDLIKPPGWDALLRKVGL